eukprot:g632.t1
MSVVLDKAVFWKRAEQLYEKWQKQKAAPGWGNADALCLCAGKSNDDAGYKKSISLHFYLFVDSKSKAGFEFPDTIIVFVEKEMLILTSAKKCTYLEPFKEGSSEELKLTLLTRSKADGNAANYKQLMDAVKASSTGKVVGSLVKEQPTGDLVRGWNEQVQASGLSVVEVAPGLASVFATKDEIEEDHMRSACGATERFMRKMWIKKMEEIVDEEKKVTHENLANELENSATDDPKKYKVNCEAGDIDVCYTPIIQSGGKYKLKYSAQSSEEQLKFDVIMCSVGLRFKNYCSNVTRTYFIDPVKSVELKYATLLDMQQRCIECIKPGMKLKQVREKAESFLKSRDQNLVKFLPKDCGFGIGLEFKETSLVLNGKNEQKFKAGMVFNVSCGFQGIELTEKERKMKDGKQYMPKVSMMVADVVIVRESGEAEVLTGKVKKDWDDISYFLGGDDDDEEDEEDDDDDEKNKENKDAKKKSKKGKPEVLEGWNENESNRSKLKQARLRDQNRALMGEKTDEQKREEHQQKIREKKWAEKRKQAIGGGSADSKGPSIDPTQLVAYKSSNQYPPNPAARTQIIVDTDKEAVLLPINGTPVPFHINTIKNVSKSEEGRHTYLRINFYAPGMGLGRDVAPAMAAMVSNQPQAWFIKELNFRSMSNHAIGTQFRMIKELQKRVRARLAEQQERADVVEQAALILTKDKKVPKLQDLSMRPQLSGRKSQGMLQAHKNGLRFSAMNGERKDILYSNIKHAIFQPCENELIVCIHFHLKNFIMIGKKKHKNLTFFTENLDGRNRSMYDPDELDEEQRERALKKRLNQMFKDFSSKVEKVAEREGYTVQFDVPYRELGFNGTPHKEMVLLQPSVHCLLNITESPTFVISLSDIEHVHLERVAFSGKNFDLVIIFKDFDKLPHRISAVSMTDLEGVKEWLDDIELTYTSGTTNLNWKNIMKTIKVEVSDGRFYFDTDENGEKKDVGWDFLKMDGGVDDEEGGESDESNFSDDLESEEEEDEDEDESDFDMSDEDESDEYSDEEEEEEGEDWEALEKKAAASDKARGDFSSKRKNDGSDDEFDRKKKKAKKHKKSRK